MYFAVIGQIVPYMFVKIIWSVVLFKAFVPLLIGLDVLSIVKNGVSES
jgi:hypothetical protein